jgi:hypothetical protein
MNMTVGGLDLPPIITPRHAFDTRTVLGVVAEYWPLGVFQKADEPSTRSLESALEAGAELGVEEFFVYRDEVQAADWAARGAAPENENSLIHFLIRDGRPQPDSVELTMVVGELSHETAVLYGAISAALAEAQNGAASARRLRGRPNIDAELRAVNCSLSRDEFSDLVEGVRKVLYPDWSRDELACHPHDALQFCDVVRSKSGAPVPDHLIMQVLLNRRKRDVLRKP